MSGIEPGSVAIVTGAAQGIGRRTAEVLSHDGYIVAMVDVQSCSEVGATLPPEQGTREFTGSVTDEGFVKRMVGSVLEQFGRVDCLVNNAGVSSIQPAEEIETAEWQRVMDVNLLAPFLLSREVGRAMLNRGEGSIVNVASVAGLLGISHRAAYNTSKHGLVGLTRTLGAEWGGRGIRVNAVCPGWVKTPMDDSATAAGHYVDSDIENRVPMGRFATVEDIALAISFLADPSRSSFVNGHVLAVDGGWCADGSWDSLRLATRG